MYSLSCYLQWLLYSSSGQKYLTAKKKIPFLVKQQEQKFQKGAKYLKKGVSGQVYSTEFIDHFPIIIKYAKRWDSFTDILHEYAIAMFGTNKLRYICPNYGYSFALYQKEDFQSRGLVMEKIPGMTFLEMLELYIQKRDSKYIIRFLKVFFQLILALELGQETVFFTHYDLHMENVVLYEPAPGQYIEFHYHTLTGVISFKSPYIAKIIDYGRSYIHDGEDSKNIYDQLCQLDECRPDCGADYGFGTFPLSNEHRFYHIVTQKKNESHDLRFLHSVLTALKTFPTPPWFKEYTDSINLEYTHRYGTAEKSCKRKVCDVAGIYKKLCTILPLSNVQLDGYHTVKYGDLHIYGNKPIEFIKV